MPQLGSTHSQQHFRGPLRLPTALLTRHRSAHTLTTHLRRAAQSRDIQPDTSADAAPPRQQQGNGSICQSWSISPAAGSDTWAHDTRAGGPMRPGSGPGPQPPQPARTLPYQYPLFDHGLDWMELAAAAADVARFRAQQKQAKTAGGGSSSSGSSSSKPAGAGDRMRVFRRQMRQLRDLPGWLLYRYYNWRVDTGSDLLLVTGMSVVLLWSASVIKHTYIDSRAQPTSGDMPPAAADMAAAASVAAAPAGVARELQPAPPVADDAAAGSAAAAGQPGSSSSSPLQEGVLSLWDDLYQVLVLSFGENFPNARVTDPLEEVFSLLVALVGLAGFALALALVEQIVLETNLANVSRGSRVYESGHYLVLGWASSQSDQEVIIKLVGQLCFSARAEGGTTIVVLTEREKLDMEELFRRTIPIPARHGSRLVFRQGSPLLPADLSSVAASYARSTIIVCDQSRSRDEADAQSLRCAILLDELDDYRGLRKGRALGHIVVETRTANAVPLLRYSCSKRVIALPTGQLNARRLAGMVKRPFVSWVTQRIWAFDSKCSVFLQPGKVHVGLLFRQVPLQYPDAVVLGVANTLSGRVRLNPPANYRVEPHDSLVLIRPTVVPAAEYGHLPALLSIPELEQLGQQQLAQQQEAAAAAQDKFGAMVYPLRHLLWRLLAAEAQETGRNTAAAAAAAAAPAAFEGGHQRAASAAAAPSNSSSSTAAEQQRYPGAGITTASDDVPSRPPDASGSAGSADWSGGSQSNPDSASASIDSSSSSSTGHKNLARAAAAPAAAAAASLPVTNNGNGNGSISSSSSSSSSRSLARSSSSSSRGLACNSAILSAEEDMGWELPAGLVGKRPGGAAAGAAAAGAGVVSDEDDNMEDDGQPFVEGDSSSSSSSNGSAGGRSGGSSSNGTVSLSGSVLDLWPEPPGATAAAAGSSAEQQQQQQQEVAGGGGYMVAGWSTLESTMDSIDALPGFGSMPQATTLDSGGSTYSSDHQPGSSDAGSSSSSSGTVSAAAAAGKPAPLPVPGSAASPAAIMPTTAQQQPRPPPPPQQANPGAAAFSQQQQPQQDSPSAFVDGAAVKMVDGAKSPSPVSARDPAAVPGPPPGMVPKWQMEEQPSNSSFNYVPREYLSADSSPEAVLVTGWSEPGFMGQLLWELDQGQSALPPGSEIVFVNAHLPDDTLGRVLKGKRLNNLKVSHVSLDPLRRDQLAVLPLHRFRAAIVLADEGWGAGDSGEAGKQQQMQQQQQQQQAMASPGDVIDQPSVLRQDALMVMVQLNIRKLLEEAGLPPINIICQKVANQGLTRFEDRRRLPLGISVNFNSMAAKLLTQVAVSPLTLAVLTHLGGDVEFGILDASEYCSRDEAISFWAVLSRAQTAGHVLLGYYVLPSHIDQPIESTINPQGLAVRSKRRVWNTGDGRLKFLIVRDRDRTAWAAYSLIHQAGGGPS